MENYTVQQLTEWLGSDEPPPLTRQRLTELLVSKLQSEAKEQQRQLLAVAEAAVLAAVELLRASGRYHAAAECELSLCKIWQCQDSLFSLQAADAGGDHKQSCPRRCLVAGKLAEPESLRRRCGAHDTCMAGAKSSSRAGACSSARLERAVVECWFHIGLQTASDNIELTQMRFGI